MHRDTALSRETFRNLARKAAALHLRVSSRSRQSLWRKLSPVVDREIERLPASWRIPVVLCYLEGRTLQEAARLLSRDLQTVRRKLLRGSRLLRHRLALQGLPYLSGTSLARFLRRGAASTVMPRALAAQVADHARDPSHPAGVFPQRVLQLVDRTLQTIP